MKILERYIRKHILQAIGLVSLGLIGLQIFILLINQLEDLGKGNYGLWQVISYVLLELPYQVYLLLPMACLLGALIGLGVLANQQALVVMRASGISIAEISTIIFKASLLLIIVVTLLAEIFIPSLSSYATDYKISALSSGKTLRTKNGLWLRDHQDFILITRFLFPEQPKFQLLAKKNLAQQQSSSYPFLLGVEQYRFDADNHLKIARKIAFILFAQGKWLAQDVQETRFLNDRIEAKAFRTMPWNFHINPTFLRYSHKEPSEMSLKALYDFQKANPLASKSLTNAYALSFWQRLMQPFSTLVMILLAIPFIFGPLRSSSLGSKLLIGAMVGFSFHILNRFFGPISQVYQWPAWLGATLPTLCFALLGLYLVRRAK